MRLASSTMNGSAEIVTVGYSGLRPMVGRTTGHSRQHHWVDSHPVLKKNEWKMKLKEPNAPQLGQLPGHGGDSDTQATDLEVEDEENRRPRK